MTKAIQIQSEKINLQNPKTSEKKNSQQPSTWEGKSVAVLCIGGALAIGLGVYLASSLFASKVSQNLDLLESISMKRVEKVRQGYQTQLETSYPLSYETIDSSKHAVNDLLETCQSLPSFTENATVSTPADRTINVIVKNFNSLKKGCIESLNISDSSQTIPYESHKERLDAMSYGKAFLEVYGQLWKKFLGRTQLTLKDIAGATITFQPKE